MASAIFYNGRLISSPGSYSQVDASGLESIGLGATGIVGLLGTSIGGKPIGEISNPEDFVRFNKPEKVRAAFRSGDLKEAGSMAFNPANDADVLAGASEIVSMKVNPALQATGVLTNGSGDAIDLTAADWGEFTNQINVTVASGTNQGKLISIVFEDTIDSGDDIGGDNAFTLLYTPGADGWTTASAQILATGIVQTLGTRGVLGLDGEITATIGSNTLDVSSDNAGDVQKATIYGLVSTAPVAEVVTLNGTSTVVTTNTFDTGGVYGIRLHSVAVGTVTLALTGGATITTLTVGQSTKGLHLAVGMHANSIVTAVADGASTKDILVVGLTTAGAASIEKFPLNGTTPVVGTTALSKITYLVYGDLEVARTATVSGTIAQTVPATQSTIQKVVDFFNAKVEGAAGFTAVTVTGDSALAVDNLDITAAPASILTAQGFLSDLYAVTAWINANSALVTAVKSTGAIGVPDNTTSALFLSGGTEGTTTFTEYQTALNLMKQARINTVVPLTADPAVHAACKAHCAYMNGIGRSERDMVAGIKNAGMTAVATKTEAKAQIVDLNTKDARVWAQTVTRYNTSGDKQVFDPQFGAVLVASMQAGSSVGTSLTHKYMNVLAFGQNSTWNPTDDAEEMIQAGLCFAENVEGVGRRIKRNITSHLTSNNLAYIEASVNEAVNFASFNFRTNMEFAVGKKGFAGTITAGKGVASGTLRLLVDEEILVAFQSLDIDLAVDTMDVSVEIAPVIPINFVKNNLHLVTIQQAA